jgi:hypothetical protein
MLKVSLRTRFRTVMYINDLSFDPAHAWFPVSGVPKARWAIEVFTTENAYTIDPSTAAIDDHGLRATGLMQLGGQRTAPGSVRVASESDRAGRVSWRIEAETPEIIKGAKLLLRDLPGTDGGWWTPTTPASTTLNPTPAAPTLLSYPWDSWQTPWVCAGEGPALALSVRDRTVRAKRFYASFPFWASSQVVEIVCDAAATERATSYSAPEIRLAYCADAAEVRDDFEAHLASLETAFDLTRWEERTDVPAWADELELVLTLHGQHWTGHVFNTFDEMAAVLQEICREVPGSRVLAYLPGWEGRYYWQYPVYQPGEDLGGEAGFARLVETARRLGVHLMPMFGANGANVNRYPDWQRAAFRSPSDRYVALVNNPDWDNDRAGEDDQIFLNPGEPVFQAHLADQVSSIVDRFGVEGVFFDTTACWFDDPRHNVYRGYRDLVAELRRRHSDLLLCGEGWYDALLAVFPMNQTWLDMSDLPRFADLPMRYSRVLGHLKDGAPGAGSTGVHEAGTNANARPLRVDGFVPALPIVHDTFPVHSDAVRTFVRALAKEPS